MKTVILHGLGQTPHDWKEVIDQIASPDVDCPELLSISPENITYSHILRELENRYANTTEPLRVCGLSMGSLLALDYTIRHKDKVTSLILMGVQYKIPTLLIDFQNLIFRCMPNKSFKDIGISKTKMIQLAHSMRSLDFSTDLNKVKCPVKIICGEKDKANLKASKQLKKFIPQAELHIIPKAGHEINKSSPKAIATLLNT